MEQAGSKTAIINELQQNILLWQGYKPQSDGPGKQIDLGPVEKAFPNGIFPTGAIHEFIGTESEGGAACSGFIAALIGKLMQNNGICIWISTRRLLFPPALKLFGIEPDRVIFADLRKETEVLWAMEESLKCGSLSAVVGEVYEMSFAQSRRLQLAVEQSRVTGFVLRTGRGRLMTTGCTARWKITPVSGQQEGLPGVGFPRWQVELLKVRNGNPGTWQLEWVTGRFRPVAKPFTPNQTVLQQLQAG